MRLTRPAAVLVSVCAAVVLPALPALAAVPANDAAGGAVTLSALPYEQTLDTSDATTDADDAQLLETCPAPATDASVWYTYTPATDSSIILDSEGSDYGVGFIVATGTPGDLETVDCAAGFLRTTTLAGVTYHVLVFDDQEDGDGEAGGTLQLSVTAGTPAPTSELTVDPVGVFNRDGSATLTGTYTCVNGETNSVFGNVSQRAGRSTVSGFGEVTEPGTCDGTAHAWSLTVAPDDGRFRGGRTVTALFSLACIDGGDYCSGELVEQDVKLRGGRAARR